MPNRFLLQLGALLMLLTFTHGTADALDATPTVTRFENGLTVLVLEDERFPLVSTRLYAHAGSAFETPQTAGVSHLLEHMVFKGVEADAAGEIARAVESAGGYLNAATSFDYTFYLTELPAARWKLALASLRDMVFKAALNPQELAREKEVVLAELERGEDNPSTRLFKTMQGMVWQGSSYEWPIIGYEETVRNLEREDLVAYVDRLYQPQSMLLVVVGDVETHDVLEEARRVFGEFRNTRPVTPPLPVEVDALELAGPHVRLMEGPYNKAYVAAAFPIPGFRSSEAAGLETLAYVLGGDETSRLYRSLKYEQQLVNTVAVSAMTLERTGMLYIHAVLDPENVPAYWDALTRELAALNETTFSRELVDRAKLNMEDSLHLAKETLGGLASKLGFFQFFEGSPMAEQNYLVELANVDAPLLARLADKYITPERLCVAALKPQQTAASTGTPEAGPDARPDQPGQTGQQGQTDESNQPEEPASTFDETTFLNAVREAWGDPVDGAGSPPTLDESVPTASVVQEELIEVAPGRTLVLLPDKTLPYTALSLQYAGGDLLLEADQQGLGELMSRVLPKGAGDRNALEIQDYLADRAANLSANAGRDLLGLSMKFPTRFSEDVLGLFQELLISPTFPEEEIARERVNQIATIRKREDQPLGLLFRELFPFLFKQHPYGYHHMGHPREIARYDREDLLALWARQREQPWVMAVCGDFDREAVLAAARAMATAQPARHESPQHTAGAPAWNESRRLELSLDERQQAHLVLVFPVPGQDTNEAPALRLLRSCLAGMSGPLFRRLRDEMHLGYTVSAFLWQSPKTGFLAFYIGVDPERLDEAREGFRQVLAEAVAAPLAAEDLERGKSQLVGDYYRDHQSLGSRATEAAGLMAQGLPRHLNSEAIEQAQDLTAADVQAAAQRHLVWENAYEAVITPSGVVETAHSE